MLRRILATARARVRRLPTFNCLRRWWTGGLNSLGLGLQACEVILGASQMAQHAQADKQPAQASGVQVRCLGYRVGFGHLLPAQRPGASSEQL